VQILIFVFSIPINFYLWSVANYLIRTAALQRDADRLERARRKAIAEGTAPPVIEAKKTAPQSQSFLGQIWHEYLAPSMTPPFIAVWAGIICAIIPGVQPALQEVLPLRAFLGACKTAGAAAVPLAIIVLGVSLMRSIVHGDGKGSADGDDEEEPGVIARLFPTTDFSRKVSALMGVPMSFPTAVAFIQLLAVPCVTYLGVNFIYRDDFRHIAALAAAGQEPDEYYQRRRLMLFTLMVEGMMPSGTNTNMICNIHSYGSSEFARLLLVQYIIATVTMAGWLSLFIATASGTITVF
jgi:predicted permease